MASVTQIPSDTTEKRNPFNKASISTQKNSKHCRFEKRTCPSLVPGAASVTKMFREYRRYQHRHSRGGGLCRERNLLAHPTLDMYLPLSKFESIH